MATQNRGQRITKLLTQVKKKFKPTPPPPQRTLLEHLLYAGLLENSPQEDADNVFETLQSSYCGWNEVRVSTRRELAEVLKALNDPNDAAERLKRTLHNVFESVYEFDLESLKKQNLGQAVKQLESYVGTTPFMVSYVVQHALGGHSIPINGGLLIALETLEVISADEASKHQVPGLERTVPKSKGPEVASILHQLGVEIGNNPYGASARKLLLGLDPSCKDRLPKKPVRPERKPASPEPVEEATEAPAKQPAAAKKKPAKASETQPVKKPAKKSPPPAAAKTKAAPTKKKPASKPTKKKAATTKKKTKTASKKLTKKKPK
jgi:endonuclease III